MNERLESFRARLRGNGYERKKERMKGKDWATLIMSGAALLISLSTAYFNFFLVSHDLSVAIGRVHGASVDPNTKKLRLTGSTDLTFINGGNRAAAISWVTYIVSRDDPQLNTCSMDDKTRYFIFQSPSFVIGSGQLLARTYDKADNETRGWEPYEDGYQDLEEQDLFAVGEKIAICLRITVTTPDSEGHNVIVPVYKYDLYESRDPSQPRRAIPIDPMYPLGKPTPLVQKSRIQFLYWAL